MNLSKNIEQERQRTIHLSNRFVTKIRPIKATNRYIQSYRRPPMPKANILYAVHALRPNFADAIPMHCVVQGCHVCKVGLNQVSYGLTKYVHIKSTTAHAPRRNWDSPNPFLASECSPPPRNRGKGAHQPAGGGLGGVPIPTRGVHCGTLYMYVLCVRASLTTTSHLAGLRIKYVWPLASTVPT